MSRCVALLRAINVGGRRVKMADLKAIFEAMGHVGVRMLAASGNVWFDGRPGARHEAAIEQALEAALGYAVETFVRSSAEMAGIVARQPFGDDAERVYVGFLKAPLGSSAVERLLALQTADERLVASDREFYWHCRLRFAESKITGPRLERALGQRTTLRNLTTVLRLKE